jgi:hypothetical protein
MNTDEEHVKTYYQSNIVEDIRGTRIKMSHATHDNKTVVGIVFTSHPLSFHPRVTNAMFMCVCVCMDMWYVYLLCVCVELWYVYLFLSNIQNN